jgi:prolyl oligopeptidase
MGRFASIPMRDITIRTIVREFCPAPLNLAGPRKGASTLISSRIRRHSAKVALCALLASTFALYHVNVAYAQQSAQQSALEQPDKYTWLEDIYGEKQLTWVKAENQRTANVIEKDPRYATNQAEALKVLDSPERLAFPAFRSGVIYNTWRDADHVRGIIRRTTLDDYKSADPKWQTVVDYDALSKADNKSWVGKGVMCLQPDETLCLLALSVGGEDAITLREIDLKTGKFVEGGFVLPSGKTRAAWVDKDTLLIGRDWGPGTMSEAGEQYEATSKDGTTSPTSSSTRKT